VYITRSGLSDHATVHHAHWYSAKLDRYIPIPEEDLEAKRRLIRDNQAHRKFRVDPADRDKARSRAPSRDARKRGRNRHPSQPGERKTSGLVGSPAIGKRRQRSPSTSSSRRVDSRVVVVVSQPSSTATTATAAAPGTAFDADSLQSHGQEMGFAPPAKSTRPEGFPVAGEPLVPYLPPPVEDDTIVGGMDEHGMVPEIVVDLEQEVEDLNTDLLTTDRQSDSPQPTSPSQEAALDTDIVADSQPMDIDLDVLTVVPSTQPEPSQTPLRRSARCYSGRRPGRSQLSDPPTAPAPLPSWTGDPGPTVGRGILRLRAPPKLDRTPASRRRPPPCTIVPLPQWTIEVPPPVPVEFRADTPILTVSAQEQGNRMPLTPDVFQDADVDYRPLTAGN